MTGGHRFIRINTIRSYYYKTVPLIDCGTVIYILSFYLLPNTQNATALAAATLSESTPCPMGILTV